MSAGFTTKIAPHRQTLTRGLIQTKPARGQLRLIRAASDRPAERSIRINGIHESWRREEYARAEQLAEEALRWAEASYPPNDLGLMKPLALRARAYAYFGHLRAAESLAQRALGLASRAPAHDPGTAFAALAWSAVCIRTARPDWARQCAKSSLNFFNQSHYAFERIEALTLIARSQIISGSFADAEDHILAGQKVLDSWIAKADRRTFEIDDVLTIRLLLASKRQDRAIRLADVATRQWNTASHPYSYAHASLLVTLAELYEAMGQPEVALTHAGDAISAWIHILGHYCVELVQTHEILARLYDGKKWDAQASFHASEARRIRQFNQSH